MSLINTNGAEQENIPVAAPLFATYVAPRAPDLKVKIRGVQHCFTQAQLVLTDPADIADFDRILAIRGNVAALVQKVDKAAAEKFARELQLKQLREHGAVKGGMNAATIQQMRNLQLLHERDVSLKAQGVDATSLALQSDIIRSQDLMLTQETATAQQSSVGPSQEAQAAHAAVAALTALETESVILSVVK